MKLHSNKNLFFILFMVMVFSSCQNVENGRKVVSLNGVWQIAKTGSFDEIPDEFPSTVPVPGLVDMSTPTLDIQDTAYQDVVYWHKRTFSSDNGDVIRLKINKAKYFTKVFVNGKLAGENPYNFTPTKLDIKPFVHTDGQENELLVAVGTYNNLPDTVVNGHDFEKMKYIPGIYDEVSLTVSGYPFIANIQVAPDIDKGQVRVVAEIETATVGGGLRMNYTIRELASKKIVSEGEITQANTHNNTRVLADFSATLSSVNLWTPENPFLYELELKTEGDNLTTRFGMRTFEAQPNGDVFLLNGQPYYMRGTNVCIYRFFEDPNRNQLPWEKQWATTLHRRFKEMNWNSIRYCIGFPPERWYDIADSLGFLIQDEFPIWTGTNGFKEFQKELNAAQLAREYEHWMRERWNHPSVVIWDAQNESVTEVTGDAIRLVRELDLSDRPWDNGYGAPVSESDAIESHPYFFVRYYVGGTPSAAGALKDLLSDVHIPANDPNEHTPKADSGRYQNPIIINEYAWMWLNRDGTPTTLTDRVYEVAFPEAVTKQQKYEAYARTMAILTEYWRAHRTSAAVMHFCGLGYSRSEAPRGQTSDNFIDLEQLTYEPQFFKYVKPAFSPVGLMVELWDKSFSAGAVVSVPVHLINDLGMDWKGKLSLAIYQNDEKTGESVIEVSAAPYEKAIVKLEMQMPEKMGAYQIVAQIEHEGELVKSIREFRVE
ncbi:MAG: hypothetical protein HC819_00550 [Cyclobacteriaceae bacterium]|nr:hypothetical protein [Cyclobacteriaceae bacterium]